MDPTKRPYQLHLLCLLMMILFHITITGADAQNPFDIKKRISHTETENSSSDSSSLTDSIEVKSTDEGSHELPSLQRDQDDTTQPEDQKVKERSWIITDSVSDAPTRFPPWWVYVYDLILLLLLASVFLYDKTIFPLIRKAFIHENFLRFLYRDTYLRKPGIFMFMNIIFILGLGFFLFRLSNHFGFQNTFHHYLVIQGITLLLFAFKYLSLYLLSILADKPFEIRFYQYWMILASGYIGLWMVPMVLMVSVLPPPYLPIAMIISLILLSFALIYRLIKALLHARIYLSKHFLQIFLYFCGIEIIPILIFLEVLTE